MKISMIKRLRAYYDLPDKITDGEILREIFQIVSTSALGKFKLDDTSLENVFAILKGAGIQCGTKKAKK